MNTKRFGFFVRLILFAALFALFAFTMSTPAQAAIPSTIGTQFPLYISSVGNNTIVKVDGTGNQSVFTSGGYLNGPQGLAFDSSSNLYVANFNNNTVVKVDSTGNQSVFTDRGDLNQPIDLAFDISGNLYVLNINNNTIVKVDSTGSQSVFTSGGYLSGPQGLAFDSSGNLYVASSQGIIIVNGAGIQSIFLSTRTLGGSPFGLAFDNSDNLYISAIPLSCSIPSSPTNPTPCNTIFRVNSTGAGLSIFTKDGYLHGPGGVAFDNSGNLYVANGSRSTNIIKVDAAGTQSVFANDGNLNFPHGLVFTRVPPNTMVGANIQVEPIDTNGGTTPITLTFAQITQGGTTSLTTSSSGPPPSVGFKLGNPATYYELSTTAVFSGPVTICINYTGINFSNESNLKLNHYENGAWVDQTISLDTANNIICASVTSLSPFAIFEAESQFNGFFQPVDNLPTLNVVKAGSAIPVKFSLNGDQGLNIFAVGYPSSIPINCDTGAPQDLIEVTVTAGNSSLSYNTATDTYTYVWKTDKAWAGMCRQLVVGLNDGSEHMVNFKFK